MKNIIDYVKEYGSHTFSESPLNEVDALVLSQLAYLDYRQFVPTLEEYNAPVSIQHIYNHPECDKILDGYWYREENKALFAAAAESVRFGSLKLNYYVNVVNEDKEVQFSAVTYVLDDKNAFVAYRGTDATIIGWKEDLNLAFSKPVYSQQLSVKYMEQVASYIGGNFYAGGHSKGGNLAMYAAMNCSEDARENLICVYSNDGPGFRPEILQAGNYEAIAERAVKFIPRSSVVGVLLESQNYYEVVESGSIGLLQHNSFSWKVEGASFVRAKNMKDSKIFWDAAMNEWILSLTEEELHSFIDTFYQVVCASEAKDVFQMGANWKKSMQSMGEALRGIDEETGKAIRKIIHALFDTAREMARAEITERGQEVTREVKELQREWKEAQKEFYKQFQEKSIFRTDPKIRRIRKIRKNPAKIVDTEEEKR